MTQWGFDFAWGYTPGFIAVLKANEAEFVCRYLSDPGGKGITAAEAQALIAAGIIVAPIWEVTGTDYTGGYNAGLADGKAAATALRGLGAPAGTYCWFAVDQGTTDTASTNAYLRGAKAGTAEFIAQLYGDFVVVEAAAAAGLGDCHWQTYAWSAGDISSRIAMYQYQNGVNVGGVSVDRTRTYKDLSGPWAHFAPVQPQPAPQPVPVPGPISQDEDMTPSVALWKDASGDVLAYHAARGVNDDGIYYMGKDTGYKLTRIPGSHASSGVDMKIDESGRVWITYVNEQGHLCQYYRPAGKGGVSGFMWQDLGPLALAAARGR